MKRILVVAALVAASVGGVGGCSKDPEPAKPAPADAERNDVVYLTPMQHLIRISLDVRGTRPTIAEIEDVERNPGRVRHYTQQYLQDPRFAERVKEIWNEALLTRQDRPYFPGPPEMIGVRTEDEFARAAGNEPLELIAHVVTKDRPFTEIVNGGYTVANDVLAAYYDISRPTDASSAPEAGWVESEYTDGRPNAGVLTTTAFHTRFTTTDSNANRGRANAWTRAVLCYDFMTRDIIVDTALDLSDPNVVNNAVRTNPSCVGCHQTLDPLASHFYGWFIPENASEEAERSYPIKTYSADLEDRWEQGTGREPGYFGNRDGERLDDLGRQIAEDPRFSLCAVQRFASGFTGVPRDALELHEVDRLNDWFIRTNYDAKKLVEEILMSPQYRVAGPRYQPPMNGGLARNPSDYDARGLKLLAPEQLNRMLADLSGFGWKMAAPDGYDLLENDIYGFRMMAGGFDSLFVTAPSQTVNATHILTLRMAAADAAGKLVDAEFALGAGDRRFLDRVDPGTVDQAAIREQAAALYKALYGEVIATESVEAGEVYDLWLKVYTRSNDGTYAWKVTMAAMLSDLRVAFY